MSVLVFKILLRDAAVPLMRESLDPFALSRVPVLFVRNNEGVLFKNIEFVLTAHLASFLSVC